MNPIYFKTCFRIKEREVVFPEEFVIITAYPTTGEKWDDLRISNAALNLEKELKSRNKWMVGIEGYDPETGHAEEGWGTVMSLDEACDLGRLYLQDAIYHINNDQISVTYCVQKRKLVNFGSFKLKLKF